MKKFFLVLNLLVLGHVSAQTYVSIKVNRPHNNPKMNVSISLYEDADRKTPIAKEEAPKEIFAKFHHNSPMCADPNYWVNQKQNYTALSLKPGSVYAEYTAVPLRYELFGQFTVWLKIDGDEYEIKSPEAWTIPNIKPVYLSKKINL
ncbi:hypothetical protein MRY82_04620 [bacterium]|nr:hypothetical protein [bacterium]